MQDHAAYAAYRRLLADIGLAEGEGGGKVTLIGADPVVKSRHRLGAASAAALAAQGTGIAAIWKLRTGRGQDVSVDLLQAVQPGLRTVHQMRQSNHQIDRMPRSPLDRTHFFPTKDGRLIYLQRTIAYPGQLVRLLDILDCAPNTKAVSAKTMQWEATALEDRLNEAKLVSVVARTTAEWREHAQGKWLLARPPVEMEKIGDAPAPAFSAAPARPLSGVRVLDMAHVLAGPVSARMMAEQGADVLHVGAPYHADPEPMVMDTGFGKRNAHIDLEVPEDVARLRELAATADIFVQSWRPGALDRHGLSAEALAKINPNIIYVSISGYGAGGPWAGRGAYETLGQTACGLAIDEGSFAHPKFVPTMTLNDYLTPYLAAVGMIGALVRRAKEGGAYHVKVSLTRTSMYVQELGRLSDDLETAQPNAIDPPKPEHMITMDGPYGALRVPAPITQYSETKSFYASGPQPLGSSLAAWLPR